MDMVEISIAQKNSRGYVTELKVYVSHKSRSPKEDYAIYDLLYDLDRLVCGSLLIYAPISKYDLCCLLFLNSIIYRYVSEINFSGKYFPISPKVYLLMFSVR